MLTPKELVHVDIGNQLKARGWIMRSRSDMNLRVGYKVAVHNILPKGS